MDNIEKINLALNKLFLLQNGENENQVLEIVNILYSLEI